MHLMLLQLSLSFERKAELRILSDLTCSISELRRKAPFDVSKQELKLLKCTG